MRFFLFFSCFISLSMSSCDSTRIFEENKQVPAQSWDRNDKISFETTIDDTTQWYNVYVNIRNSGKYAYSNIYLFLTTKYPDGTASKDTLNCFLQDEIGRWAGRGAGDLWDNQIIFKPGTKFRQKGKYVFEYEQAMREEKLEGISDVGLRIEKAE